MENVNTDYAFISKEPIVLECGIKIKQYSIDEIEHLIGYQKYERILWSLSREPYEFKFDLEDNGIDFKDMDSYDIFLILNAGRNIEDIISDFNFIFENRFTTFVKDEKVIFIASNNVEISGKTINSLKEVIRKMFFFDKPRERKPANEDAKKLIKKQIALQSKNRVKYDIYSIIEGIVWHENSSYRYEDIIKLTPRQVYAGYKNIKKIKEFNNTIDGIYSGVINSKDVNFDKINWINKE